MKNQFRNFLSFSIILNVITILLGVITYRLLGPSGVGKLNIIIQIVTVIATISTLSLSDMMARYLPELEREEQNNLFKSSLLISSTIITIFIIIYLILNYYNLIKLPDELKGLVLFVIIHIIVQTFMNQILGYFRGLGEFKNYLKYESAVNITSRLFGLIIYFSFYQHFESYYFSQLIVLSIVVSGFFLQLKGLFSKFRFGFSNKIIRYTFVLFFGSLVYMGATSIDIFLVRYYLDVTSVGLFTAAIMIPKTMQTVFLSKLQIPFLYYFNNKHQLNREKILEQGTLLIGCIAGFVSLFLLYQAKNIILYIFGSNYVNSVIVLQVFSIHFFLIALLTFSGVYFNVKDKPSYALYIGVTGLAINILLDVLLIPLYGLSGVALAHISGIIVQILIYFSFLRIKFGIKVNKLFYLFLIFLISYGMILFNQSLFLYVNIILLIILISTKLFDIQLLISYMRK